MTYHVAIMECGRKRFQFFSRAEVLIESIQILLPVPVVGLSDSGVTFQIVCDGRNPNLRVVVSTCKETGANYNTYSSKSHALYVVQLIDDALVRAATIPAS